MNAGAQRMQELLTVAGKHFIIPCISGRIPGR